MRLAVEHMEPPGAQALHQGHQGHLGRIAAPAKHGLSEKSRAQGEAVDTAHEFALQPDLHRVCKAQGVQCTIGLDHLLVDPGPGLSRPGRLGAGFNDTPKIRVHGQRITATTQALGQGAIDAKVLGKENRARVGGVPENRRRFVPGENALGVGGQKPLGLEPPPIGEEAVGVRLAGIGKGILIHEIREKLRRNQTALARTL